MSTSNSSSSSSTTSRATTPEGPAAAAAADTMMMRQRRGAAKQLDPIPCKAPPAAADDIPWQEQEHPPRRSLSPPAHAPTKWRMALYIRQPFPDNHVPDSFLSKLVTNGQHAAGPPKLGTTILAACVVAQQLSVAALFLLAFSYSQAGWLPLSHFLLLDLGLAAAGLALMAVVSPPGRRGGGGGARGLSTGSGSGSGGGSGGGLKGALGWSLLFTMGLRVLSPVLRTLTSSYSDDTVQALALALLGLHLLSHDYGAGAGAAAGATLQEREQEQQPELHHGTLALNAAVLAAVLLASRLGSNERVFCLILLAVELFAFFPLARHRLRRASPVAAHLALTALLALATAGLLRAAGQTPLCLLYLATVAFVALACPLWLRLIHPWKCSFQGPWDVATVESVGD